MTKLQPRTSESLRGVVETVFYSGPTFTAGRLRTADGELGEVRRQGFRPRRTIPCRCDGRWDNHPKYGRQFAVDWLEPMTWSSTRMDWRNFLANHPDIKGIGPAKARLIADAFGAHSTT